MRADGVRLALSWLTVLPVRSGAVDARVARQAIALAPLVGVLLGAVTAAFLHGLAWLGAPSAVAGLLAVGLLALGTRGMHLDGLADTADGLGCYGPPERALAVMKDGGAGPFAVVTLVVVLGAQASAFGDVPWGAVVVALAAGRAAFAACCLEGVPAARPEGLGALVAGSQSWPVVALWWTALAAASFVVVPHGPVAVAVALGAVLLLVRHTRKRFGGITGDVLGAACELATLIVLVGCTLG
ncbi:adenosylcobinamide-GDP ribazoletransferase [Umezawaea sp.]|uniref:adenosylcobinamide-GDP ribazoletransferase n=1 Tax=Umezawaea sp. TaxID=1955258 RepID=UPI002ECFAE66